MTYSLDGFATELYHGLRASQSTTKVHVLFQFGQNSTEADNQDVLLQWLIASGRVYFPGTAFGPVNYAGHAGVLFYPHGSLTPTAGPTSVIDVRDAEAIVNAAANGTAVPAANDTSRSLEAWAMYRSGLHTPPPLAPTLGPLARWTGQQYAYFDFPDPQSALNPTGQVEFYNSCAAPDGVPQIVQTHSPAALCSDRPAAPRSASTRAAIGWATVRESSSAPTTRRPTSSRPAATRP